MAFQSFWKIRSPDILHKTEAGGVVLDLRSSDAVKRAADELTAAARERTQGSRVSWCRRWCQASKLLSARAATHFMGRYCWSVLAAFWSSSQKMRRCVPVTRQDVSAMIDGLKLNKLLTGFRGRPAADRAALKSTVLALAQFFLDHRARIEDIEINPLMVRPQGAVAVDVRVIWRNNNGGEA